MAPSITAPSTVDLKTLQVRLPLACRDKWESFGITWLEKFDPSPFLAIAQFPLGQIPTGWNVEQSSVNGWSWDDARIIKVLDPNRDVKAYCKIELKEQRIYVHFPEEDPNNSLQQKFENLESDCQWEEDRIVWCEEIPRLKAVNQKLIEFVKAHPEFKSQVTKPYFDVLMK